MGVARPLVWRLVRGALPSADLCACAIASEVAGEGVKFLLEDPTMVLKDEEFWPSSPATASVQVAGGEQGWRDLTTGLVERGIFRLIPLSRICHIGGKPLLSGLFAVGKVNTSQVQGRSPL